ncbi:DsbA family protein [Mycolicibacterium insubricum]
MCQGGRMKRSSRVAFLVAVLLAAVLWPANIESAHAAEAEPVGDVISIGSPDAPQHVELYLDPLCPYSGQMVRGQGAAIGQRIESGRLRVDLRLVAFLDKYSASTDYDRRAIDAAFTVADQSRTSATIWGFIEQIYAADQQPKEGGATDLTNDQLATLADRVGAPQSAQDMIRDGSPSSFDPGAIAAHNLDLLKQFPEPGVPLVVIAGKPLDGNSDWLTGLG